MIDKEWTKNLAQAEFSNGSWQNLEYAKIEKQLIHKIKETTNLIYYEALDVCSEFNQFSMQDKYIRVLPIEDSQGTKTGIVLLRGSSQLKLHLIDSQLIATMTLMIGFKRKTKEIMRFKPCYDSLGSLYWMSSNEVYMNNELMVKILFEELVKNS